jgi:transglutaminase-like putative cysteine protease
VESGSPYVRQQIAAEPMDGSELFCVVPVVRISPDRRLRVDTGGEYVERMEDYRGRQIDFEVATTGIVGERQRMYLPSQRALHESVRAAFLAPFDSVGRQHPFAGLRETAERVLRDKGVDPRDHYAVARALHDYLKYSGNYTYSLEGQVRDERLDPLEDFVTVRRAGHCEYFAGALVMMLRSQGVPARMAIGFKGGEWNAPGMYYQVQQLHAHTWVEAYLDAKDVPPSAFAADETKPPGAWMVLDPTVGESDGGNAGQATGLLARLRQYTDYTQVLWANYVVGLSARRQQEGIYAPLVAGVRAGIHNLVGPDVWRHRLDAAANSPLGRFWRWYRRHWFDWRGGLVAAGISLLLVALYLAVRRFGGQLRRLVRKRSGKHEPPSLEMYRRLEAVLARKGFQRPAGQTAHEFAVAAGGQLAESAELNRVSHLPRRIVESFYRVRFGGRTLDNREGEAVELALRELELALGRRRR